MSLSPSWPGGQAHRATAAGVPSAAWKPTTSSWWVRDSPAAHFHCVLDPHLAPGYLAWVVHDGEEVHVGVGGQVHRYAVAQALRTFTRRMHAHYDLDRGEVVERRGGRIPVGGVLPRIANERGLLIGDAAGAVSPLTAGGLDPCLRLSRFAIEVTLAYLGTGDATELARYDGRWFRRRFRKRLALRNALVTLWTPAALEAGCALLRTPPGLAVARDIFFGRGSFPDPPRRVAQAPTDDRALVPD